jgi:hypothetical protein
MKIVTTKTLNTIDQNSEISYVPVPAGLLQTAGISSADELNVELLPIENDTTNPDQKLAFGIVITKKTDEYIG